MALNYTVGYTEDDKIFFQFKAPSQDGTPLEATLIIDPKEAIDIGASLKTAVTALKDRSRILTVH